MRGMSDNNYATLQSIEKQQHKQTLQNQNHASLHSIKIAALVKRLLGMLIPLIISINNNRNQLDVIQYQIFIQVPR